MAYQGMPHDTNGGFSDVPFVAGALVGRRAFRIRRRHDGLQIIGAVFDDTWSTTAVNEAVCHKDYFNANPAKHNVASIVCHCGFHAYLQETPETRTYRHSVHRGTVGVEGVIFGFGTTTAGSLGFRCAKARLLGLAVPDHCELQDLTMVYEAMEKFTGVRWYDTISDLLEDHPLSMAGQYRIQHPGEEPSPGIAS